MHSRRLSVDARLLRNAGFSRFKFLRLKETGSVSLESSHLSLRTPLSSAPPTPPPRTPGRGTDPRQPPSPPPEPAAEGRGAARAGLAGRGSASPRPGPAQQVRPGPTSHERSGRLTPTMFLSDLDAATHVSSASSDPASWPPPPRPPPSPPSSPPPSRRAPAFTHTAVAAHALCALASLSNGSTVGRQDPGLQGLRSSQAGVLRRVSPGRSHCPSCTGPRGCGRPADTWHRVRHVITRH